MDDDNCRLAAGLVSPSYIAQGQQALARRHRLVKSLLSSRRMPEEGWDDGTIEMFIQDCARMDSNNFLDNVGVGEREARVACGLVARRHYGLAHGIGRSGDVAAEQPKAAGSSLLAKLANLLAADALRLAGMGDLGAVTVLPLATGMALTMTLLALRPSRPPGARYVIWSRIDQKTCLKAITAACLEPVVIELRLVGDELQTDMQAIEEAIVRLGPDAVMCVATTTSCFAPRAADDVVAVAKLCERTGVGHVINNAYGVQSAALCALVTSAWRKGRVDALVQSTDKNFLVPVGGALVAAGARRPGLVGALNKTYPGRAAVAAHLDLLMTLLHWGAAGWRQVLQEREALFPYLRQRLLDVAASVNARRSDPTSTSTTPSTTAHSPASAAAGSTVRAPPRLRVLDTPGNPISIALALEDGLLPADDATTAETAETVQAADTAAEQTGAVGVVTGSSGDDAGTPSSRGGAAACEPGTAAGRSAGSGGGVAGGGSGVGGSSDLAEGLTHPAAAAAASVAAAEARAGQGDERAAAAAAEAQPVGAPQHTTGGATAFVAPPAGAGGRSRAGGKSAAGAAKPPGTGGVRDKTLLGAMLWSRCVSGTRVVARDAPAQAVAGITFPCYGAHHGAYPHTYLTAAAAVGTTRAEVDAFATRLEACLLEYDRKASGRSEKAR